MLEEVIQNKGYNNKPCLMAFCRILMFIPVLIPAVPRRQTFPLILESAVTFS